MGAAPLFLAAPLLRHVPGAAEGARGRHAVGDRPPASTPKDAARSGSPARLCAARLRPIEPVALTDFHLPDRSLTQPTCPWHGPGCQRGLQRGLCPPYPWCFHCLSAMPESGKPVCQHACLFPHVPVHAVVVLRGCCAGGPAALELSCCQRCPRGLSSSLLPFMVTTAPAPPSTISPTSPMNMDPAVHHPGVVTLLGGGCYPARKLACLLLAVQTPGTGWASSSASSGSPLRQLSPVVRPPGGCAACSPPPGVPSPANWGSPSEPQWPQPQHQDPDPWQAAAPALCHPTLPTAEFLPQPGHRHGCPPAKSPCLHPWLPSVLHPHPGAETASWRSKPETTAKHGVH